MRKQRQPEPHIAALVELYSQPRSVSSDFARAKAQEIAALASLGYITTMLPASRGVFGKLWRPTALGLLKLQEHTDGNS